MSNVYRTPVVVALSTILALPLPVFATIFAGIGFFVTSDGYFLTCFHVIEGAQRIALRSVDGSTFDAEIVAVDRSYGLAVLKANGKFSPLPIDDTASVKRGTDVFAVGFPDFRKQNAEPKRLTGVISSLSGTSDNAVASRITISVPAANCGAPVVTHHGNVVGIVARLDALMARRSSAGDGVGYANEAVKSSYALALLDGIPDTRNKLAKPSTRRYADISELGRIVEKAVAIVSVDTNRLIAEEQAGEREQSDKLRRAREKEELRRAESVRKLEAEQARQREINRLQALVSNLGQIESSLHQQVWGAQQELTSTSRDPASIPAVAKRSELESRLIYLHHQLNETTTSKQAAMRRLTELQIR